MVTSLSKSHILLLVLLFAGSLTRCRSHCNFLDDDDGKGTAATMTVTPTTSIKGMFVFGSSLVDNGNNKFLETISNADYLPYGVDFPLGPTGRFTNGKNVVDLLGDHLGLPLIPPYLDPTTKGPKIVHGVNFASGGSGIMDDTGSFLGEVISLKQQISYFEGTTLGELETELGCRSSESLSRYLFVIGTGGNDYSFNYFLNTPPNSEYDTDDNLQAFTSNLTTSLSLHLQKLYRLGARKFALISVYPIGCYPYVIGSRPTSRRCVQSMNRAAHLFNSGLISLVDSLPTSTGHLPGSHFVFINSYKVIRDIIKDPLSRGFTYAEQPCCKVLSLEEGGNGVFCKRSTPTCSNRTSHVFFDGLHPSEAANARISAKAFASSRKAEVYPFNIQHLASL